MAEREKIYKVQVRLGSSLRMIPVSAPKEVSKASVAKIINGFSFNETFREKIASLKGDCKVEAITTMSDSKPVEVVGIAVPEDCK